MNEDVKNLFIYIADEALNRGLDTRLEWKDYHSTSKTLNGALTDGNTTDNGLILSVNRQVEIAESDE